MSLEDQTWDLWGRPICHITAYLDSVADIVSVEGLPWQRSWCRECWRPTLTAWLMLWVLRAYLDSVADVVCVEGLPWQRGWCRECWGPTLTAWLMSWVFRAYLDSVADVVSVESLPWQRGWCRECWGPAGRWAQAARESWRAPSGHRVAPATRTHSPRVPGGSSSGSPLCPCPGSTAQTGSTSTTVHIEPSRTRLQLWYHTTPYILFGFCSYSPKNWRLSRLTTLCLIIIVYFYFTVDLPMAHVVYLKRYAFTVFEYFIITQYPAVFK